MLHDDPCLLVDCLARCVVVVVNDAAVCTTIVGRGQTTAVIVAKLDDDVVSRLDDRGDRVKATLTCIAARRTSGDRHVDHAQADVVREVSTPS